MSSSYTGTSDLPVPSPNTHLRPSLTWLDIIFAISSAILHAPSSTLGNISVGIFSQRVISERSTAVLGR